jgi:hypothetical protein
MDSYETLGQIIMDLNGVTNPTKLYKIIERIRQTQREGKEIAKSGRGIVYDHRKKI